MRKLIAFAAALFLLGSMAGTVGAAGGDKAVAFDGSRAKVYERAGAPLARANGAAAITVAKQFLAARGRDAATLASLKVEAKFTSRGITHITYGQSVGGLRVAGAYTKVAVNAKGDLVHVIDNLAKVPSSVAGAQVGATKALNAAITKNLPGVADRPAFIRKSGNTSYFKQTASFRQSPSAERVLVARQSGALEQGFLVTTWTKKGNKLHQSVVDRAGGVAASELRTASDSYNVYTVDPGAGTQMVVPAPATATWSRPRAGSRAPRRPATSRATTSRPTSTGTRTTSPMPAARTSAAATSCPTPT